MKMQNDTLTEEESEEMKLPDSNLIVKNMPTNQQLTMFKSKQKIIDSTDNKPIDSLNQPLTSMPSSIQFKISKETHPSSISQGGTTVLSNSSSIFLPYAKPGQDSFY